MKLPPPEVLKREKELIGKFPNTYTYTKNLAEKSLYKNRGDLPVVLFRPSIIASSEKEPFEGWTDSLAAAGGLTLLSSLGLIKFMPSRGYNAIDIIPVDIVSNGILISIAHCG